MREINVCPSTLAEGYSTYSQTAFRRLFFNKKVSHVMPYSHLSDKNNDEVLNNTLRISLSGVQEKYSAIIDKGVITIAPEGVQGRYILKPIPPEKSINYRHQIPANEHLTMQIARQVFKIDTAENGLVFYSDDYPAYITKRFDVKEDGSKINQEDFASLIGMSKQLNGSDFKYEGSYEDIANEIKKRVAAYRVEMIKFFDIIIFNYIFGNNDAHLKNFSLMQTVDGDYKLTPAYDLLNATLHVESSDFALKDELSNNLERSNIYKTKGHPAKEDFINFGILIGLNINQIDKIVNKYLDVNVPTKVYSLIERSFLDDRLKRMYKKSFNNRLTRFSRV